MLPQGTGSGAIRIVPYDPEWPARFAAIERELTDRLGCLIGSVHHIGSTAVAGLAAKPKIDIDALVVPGQLAGAIEAMRGASGWTFHGEPYGDGMWTFTQGRGSWGARLYLCAPGNPVHLARILFRDHLRAHAGHAEAYAALKRRLAVEADGDWTAYTGGKSAFVAEMVRLARGHADAD